MCTRRGCDVRTYPARQRVLSKLTALHERLVEVLGLRGETLPCFRG